MSYEKMMRWNRKHRKGISYKRGWMGFDHSVPGRFTPSAAFLDEYFEYKKECEKRGVEPVSCEKYYHTPNFAKRSLLIGLLRIESNQYCFPAKTYFFIMDGADNIYHHSDKKWRKKRLKQLRSYSFETMDEAKEKLTKLQTGAELDNGCI